MKKLIYIILFLFSLNICFSQKENYNWYFGENAGITFNPDGIKAKPILDGNTNTYSCATISDKFGNLQFYFDYGNIWNRNHQIMPNGDNLLSAYNIYELPSSLIVPNPKDNNIYYLFYPSDTNGINNNDTIIRYSIVDMSKDNGNGTVITKDSFLVSGVEPGFAAVINNGGTSYWLITQNLSEKEFLTFQISKEGVQSIPVKSSTDILQPANEYSIYLTNPVMKISPDGTKLVVLSWINHSIDNYDFDNSNGTISNHVDIYDYKFFPGESYPYEMPYGIEFSPDSKKLYFDMILYISVNSILADYSLYQLDLTEMDRSKYIKKIYQDTAKQINDSSFYCFGNMQLGPDNRIYIANLFSKYLSVINNPNNSFDKCGFVYNGQYLGGRVSDLGLPNLVVKIPDCKIGAKCIANQLSFCYGDSLLIQAGQDYQGDYTYLWSTGDTSGTINIKKGGKYSVVVRNVFGCTDSAEIDITEYPKPIAKIEIIGDTIMCKSDSIMLAAQPFDTLNNRYEWSNGKISHSIMIGDSGEYKLKVINNYGCSDSTTVSINFYPKPVSKIEVHGNTNLCKGDTVELLVIPNDINNFLYQWSSGQTTSSINVTDSGFYQVKVTNKYGCKDSSIIRINLNPSFKADINSNTITNICKGDTITLTAEPVDDKLYIYKWSNGDLSNSIQVTDSGFYKVKIINKYGCTDSAEIKINLNSSFIASITSSAGNIFCKGDTVKLTAIPNDEKNYTYNWSTGSKSNSVKVSDSGFYKVKIYNQYGCSDSATFYLQFYSTDSVYIESKGNMNTICLGDSIELKVFPSDTNNNKYNWSTNQTTPSIIVRDSGFYYVTVRNKLGCNIKTGFSVYLKPTISLSLDTLYSIPGDNISLPIYLKVSSVTFKKPTNLLIELTMSADIFLPVQGQEFLKNSYIDSIGILHLLLELINFDIDSVKKDGYILKGMTLLGNKERNILNISDIILTGNDICIENSIGLLVLKGICSFGIRGIELFSPSDLEIVSNPTISGLAIKAKFEEKGSFNLNVFSVEGILIFNKIWLNNVLNKQEQNVLIDISNFSQGVYFAILQSPSGTVVKKIVIIK